MEPESSLPYSQAPAIFLLTTLTTPPEENKKHDTLYHFISCICFFLIRRIEYFPWIFEAKRLNPSSSLKIADRFSQKRVLFNRTSAGIPFS